MLEGTTETFRLGLTVTVDPAYERDAVLAGVEAALRAAYAFEARGLIEPVFLSELVAVAHTVPGVLAVDVDHLYTGRPPTWPTACSRRAGRRRVRRRDPGRRARARSRAVRRARGVAP